DDRAQAGRGVRPRRSVRRREAERDRPRGGPRGRAGLHRAEIHRDAMVIPPAPASPAPASPAPASPALASPAPARPGLPGLRRLDHIGFTVPDLAQAHQFLTEVLGCEYLYALGPFRSADVVMPEQLGCHPPAVMRQLA